MNLSKRQKSILVAIKGGSTTLTTISKKLSKNPGHVSRYLKKLKALGILTTKIDTDDYRIIHYSLNKKAKLCDCEEFQSCEFCAFIVGENES